MAPDNCKYTSGLLPASDGAARDRTLPADTDSGCASAGEDERAGCGSARRNARPNCTLHVQ
eukprot:3848950-Prymnesium_polylepis.1